MSKEITLEDFVENYIQNRARSETKDGYRRWLSENGIDSKKIYADSVKDITGDYKRAKSEYGKLAESLGDLGLSASGYSDYLNGKAYSDMQKRKAGARAAYADNEAKNRSAYGEYLSKKVDEEKAKYNSAINEITNAKIMNYDEAYNYAISQGLSEEAAGSAAQTANEIVRKKTRESAIKAIVTHNFGRKQAREYALALGLSTEEADELAEYANSINRSQYYTSDYLEYLKKQWASENDENN